MKTLPKCTLLIISVFCFSCNETDKPNPINPDDKLPTDSELIFSNASESSCNNFANIYFNDLKLENCIWNAGDLEPGTYSQCIYLYEKKDKTRFGWKWQFPDYANGVLSYPEVIFGWKPWANNSTTKILPMKIGQLNRLKIQYETVISVNGGLYNLAFDIWIGNSENVKPTHTKFELMIWEDAQNITPFGSYQGSFETSSGIYQFTKGEPDWEPEGCEWTYLAFYRSEKRQQGIVDVDEIIKYLLDKKIITQENFIFSIEFGNEVGNSTGSCIVQDYQIVIE